jgi:hypothetical protein
MDTGTDQELPMNELVYYDEITQSLSQAVKWGGAGLGNIPGLLKMVIEKQMWRKRVVVMTGEVKEFRYFEEYVIAHPPEGLGADVKMLQRLCCNEPDLLDLIEQAIESRQGERTDLHDNIMKVDGKEQGTSAEYALRRLRKDRPDLHQRVTAGELSPNKAMIEAGFRKRTVPIPVEDIDATARALKRLMTPDQLTELIARLIGKDGDL